MFYKFYGWFSVVLGTLAILGSLDDSNIYGVLGGVMFITAGVCILQLLEKK
jgi:hypothetical protein